MHGLDIMGEVVRVVERTMGANGLTKVKTVVPQVGDLSGVVPRFLGECYAAVCYKTTIEGSGLEIEMVPGLARCRSCGTVFNVVENNGTCLTCRDNGFDILSGRDFFIKEIIAY